MTCQEKNDVSVKKNIGQRLRAFMKENRYSSKKIAEIMRVTPESISRYLNGHQLIDSPQLIQLVNGSKINLLWLLTGEGSMMQDSSSLPVELRESKEDYISEELSDFYKKVVKILKSNSIYRQALAANINAFDEALKLEKNMKERVDCLEEENKKTKTQMAILEKAVKSQNEIPSMEITARGRL